MKAYMQLSSGAEDTVRVAFAGSDELDLMKFLGENRWIAVLDSEDERLFVNTSHIISFSILRDD